VVRRRIILLQAAMSATPSSSPATIPETSPIVDSRLCRPAPIERGEM
jgi:hypothetical protein